MARRGSQRARSTADATGWPPAPQLAATVKAPPAGDGWLHEIEFDGYRLLAELDQGVVRLANQRGQDWTAKFPELVQTLAALPVEQAVFDGEVTAIDEVGRTSLPALRAAIRAGHTVAAVYFVFDLLQLDGLDMTIVPLIHRKQRLAETLAAANPTGAVRQSLYLGGEGGPFFSNACELGVLGMVSKRANQPYRPGPGDDWQKTRCPKARGRKATPAVDQLRLPTAPPAPAQPLPTRPLPPVRLTNPDRVLYPAAGITKLELAQFYTDIADWILPHLLDRPLSIVRCPDGLSGPKFFQKNAAPGLAPSLIKAAPAAAGPEPVMAVSDLSELLNLVQISTLEIHAWGSRMAAIERPDRVVIDLDPDPDLAWSAIAEAAREVRARLAAYKLESFLKTTGGKGLHVVVPLAPVLEWPLIKEFTRQFAAQMAADQPDRYTIAAAKSSRRGRVLVDYLRNARGATAVAAYSTRAQPGAPVSVPLGWEELSPSIRPPRHTIRDLRERLGNLSVDPWREISHMPQTLPGWVVEKTKLAAERKR